MALVSALESVLDTCIVPEIKRSLLMKERKKPLRIFGPNGLKHLIAKFDEVNNYRLLEQPFPVEIIEVKAGDELQILPELQAATLIW